MRLSVRLSGATLADVPASVSRPIYDRDTLGAGIIHFGIGAFHRAHQAWYTDAAMNLAVAEGGHAPGWMITGVSLRSPDVAEQMNPQGGLYTLVERSAQVNAARIVGAVREVIVAPRDPEAVIARIAAPATQIASFTITEKGYCRAADGSLDADLAGPGSVYRFLADGLARRRAAGLGGLTLMSCDNLADNGRALERLLGEYCARTDADLGAWIAAHCTFPCTMIDRIVPATTDADRTLAATLTGLDDAAAVMTEPFSQWVIEDRFAGPRPAWERVGAELVGDVAPYETAKLRMLNGAHSALAYLGLEAGHGYVHEAVADAAIRPLVERLMRDEALPTIEAAPGHDLSAYADALLERFANPALQHRLIQIAMDGSQKIPQRWLATLAANRAAGRACPSILAALGAWLRHVRGDNVARWGKVDDPLAGELAALWQGRDQGEVARALFGEGGLLAAAWQASDAELAAIPAR